MTVRQRLARLEVAARPPAAVIVTPIREGQSYAEAWAAHHGDEPPRPGSLRVFLRRFTEAPGDPA